VRSLGHAIGYEASRQIELLDAGERIIQETRHWNEAEGRTHSLRSKEEAYDYRYFPEPDLVPVAPSAEWLTEVRESLPMLPAARRQRLGAAANGNSPDVAVVVERGLDELVLAAVELGAEPARAVTHAVHNLAVEGASALTPARFAELVKLEAEGALTATQAKKVLGEVVARGGDADPAAIASELGYEAVD